MQDLPSNPPSKEETCHEKINRHGREPVLMDRKKDHQPHFLRIPTGI